MAKFVEDGRDPDDGELYARKVRNLFGDAYGVKGASILGALPGIKFPWSFPPDVMHLFYENVIPRVTRHYRGVFFMGADEGADEGAGAGTGGLGLLYI